MENSLMVMGGTKSAPESGSYPDAEDSADQASEVGMATVRIPLSSLPEGITQGSRGKASFVVNEVDGEAAEITIDGVEAAEPEEGTMPGRGESDLQDSLAAAMR